MSDTKSRNEIIKDLKILAAQKVIIENEPGSYLVKAVSQDYYEGTIDMTSRRTAYFICDEFEDDVFIPTNNLNHALDKDKVKVYVYNRRRGKSFSSHKICPLKVARPWLVNSSGCFLDLSKSVSGATR